MRVLNFVIIFIVCISKLWAEDIVTEISPPEPVKNESFYLTFRIKTSGDEAPIITFVPSGAKILGKKEEGVSISTVVINGRFTTTREQNYVYELVSSQPNMVIIKKIQVEMGGKISTHADIHLNILDQPRRIPDAFMEAQVSKTRPFVGEGVDVNYFLYFKTSMSANDVKEFPKLNKFIKRFHHINAPVETVQYHGEVMKRILAYSARIYPEKAGPATIDPMIISVQLVQNVYNSPFGGFGMGSQRVKNADLASKPISIEVLPLPSEHVPPGFTGLVGDHDFVLTPGKDKYLVNEPIELKLEVRGKGALEKFEAPVLYTDGALEQFDTKGDMSEVGNSSAKKVFEYTYLARQATTLKEREMSLAYFDPSTGRYIEKKIKIPGFLVSGVAAVGASGGSPNAPKKTEDGKTSAKDGDDFLSRWLNHSSDNKQSAVEKTPLGLVSPNFSTTRSIFSRWLDLSNYVVGFIILAILFNWHLASKNSEEFSGSRNLEIKKYVQSLKKNGLNYSDLYKIVSAIDRNNMLSKGGISIAQVIEQSQLTAEAKSYFVKALESCEGKTFGQKKSSIEITYEAKHFNELMKKV
jgi:hypothetical protein